MIVAALEQSRFLNSPNIGKLDVYWDHPAPADYGWIDILRQELEGVSRLGIEPSQTQEISWIITHFSPRQYSFLEELRLIKSPAEIEILRLAARYADFGVKRVIQAAYHGASPLELVSQDCYIQRRLLQETGFDRYTSTVLLNVLPAPFSDSPLDFSKMDRRLLDGPHIAQGLVRASGYNAGCERTFFTANPHQDQIDAFETIREARRNAFNLARPGVPCAELDLTVRQYIKDKGFGVYLRHRTGHGCGLLSHEAPWIAEGNQDVLRENMVINIEPGIYLPEIGGFRYSDVILITSSGCELLTHYPSELKKLIILPFKPLKRIRGFFSRRTIKPR